MNYRDICLYIIAWELSRRSRRLQLPPWVAISLSVSRRSKMSPLIWYQLSLPLSLSVPICFCMLRIDISHIYIYIYISKNLLKVSYTCIWMSTRYFHFLYREFVFLLPTNDFSGCFGISISGFFFFFCLIHQTWNNGEKWKQMFP